MNAAPSLRDVRRKQNDFSEELAHKGWYHSFELPDGTRIDGCMPLAWERERWSRFPFPPDLTGKRLLDIGAWDGWFSFEAERRGAAVTSVDCVEVANYLRMHRRLGSRADYRNLDLYELPTAGLGRFDFVLCLGVLYHLKHPVLGLEVVCSLTTDTAVIETFVTDSETWREHVDDIPTLEFYETDELNGQVDNWVGPTVGCLLAMCRAAGFVRVELLNVDRANAVVACRRKWEAEPAAPAVAPPELISAANTANFGINFSSRRDEFVTCWFRTEVEPVTRDRLRLEIGGFGAPAVYVRRDVDNAWLGNFRLPPGAAPGWNAVRLRLAESAFSAPLRIAVDMPVTVEKLRLSGVHDGVTWRDHEAGEYLSCWVEGLPDNVDLHNLRLWAGETRLAVTWVGEPDAAGRRQVNARIPGDCPKGEHELRVVCGGGEAAERLRIL